MTDFRITRKRCRLKLQADVKNSTTGQNSQLLQELLQDCSACTKTNLQAAPKLVQFCITKHVLAAH